MKWAQSHTYLGWAFGDCCGPGTVSRDFCAAKRLANLLLLNWTSAWLLTKFFSGRHVIPKSTQLLLLMLRIMSVVGLLILVLH